MCLRVGAFCVHLSWVMSVKHWYYCPKCHFFLLVVQLYCRSKSDSQTPQDKNAKHATFSSPGQWPIHVIMGPVQAASNIPWRMSWTFTSLPQNCCFFVCFKALQFAVSSYVTKIQNLWPETAWGERLHRQFPRGLMCFQSGDHLFCCLMSSVINKCMALISLRVAGALELVWSFGDGGSMPAWVLLEMVIRAWGGGLWADALTLYWLRLPWFPPFI